MRGVRSRASRGQTMTQGQTLKYRLAKVGARQGGGGGGRGQPNLPWSESLVSLWPHQSQSSPLNSRQGVKSCWSNKGQDGTAARHLWAKARIRGRQAQLSHAGQQIRAQGSGRHRMWAHRNGASCGEMETWELESPTLLTWHLPLLLERAFPCIRPNGRKHLEAELSRNSWNF